MSTIRACVWLCFVGCGLAEGVEDNDVSDEHGEVASSLDDAVVVRSVRTDDGFAQVRQNATVAIVIRGRNLEATTSIEIAGAYVTLDSATATEVHATLYTSNAPPALLDVAVTSPAGTVVAPGALRLTPFVVAPDATGHGTYQSPMGLCDPEIENIGSGSIVQLRAGTHRCGRMIFIAAGAVIEGAGRDNTVVTGTEDGPFSIQVANGLAGQVTTLRRLTLAQPSAIGVWTGDLLLDRVDTAAPIFASSDVSVGPVTFDHVRYEGAGTAIDAPRIAIASSQFRHCDVAIASSISLTVDDVLIEDCALGIHVLDGDADIGNSRFVDNDNSIWTQAGTSTVHDSVIRASAGPRVPSIGMLHSGGYLTATRMKVTGQADIGIALQQFSSFGHASLSVEDSEIVGGRIGIGFDGIENGLYVRGSTIRRQSQASLYISSLDGPIDLGTPGYPGNNTFSVLPGGFVIDDDRFTANFRAITAAGNTLNGASLAGVTVEGPAVLAPYYRIAHNESLIEF